MEKILEAERFNTKVTRGAKKILQNPGIRLIEQLGLQQRKGLQILHRTFHVLPGGVLREDRAYNHFKSRFRRPPVKVSKVAVELVINDGECVRSGHRFSFRDEHERFIAVGRQKRWIAPASLKEEDFVWTPSGIFLSDTLFLKQFLRD